MVKVSIQRELTSEDIAGITITSVEQAIGYWGEVREYDGAFMSRVLEGNAPPCFAFDDDARLFEVRVVGDEDSPTTGQPLWFSVTPRVIALGISKVMAGVRGIDAGKPWRYHEWQFTPHLFADMVEFASMDADEADWVIQLGLFGKLVFR